ncbi:MAG TPA: copper chaperone PCu(A)C, partial [Rhizobiales bacterium]|nr:copper chaperone PCu(A)C [Hyphomicrobiales bacterium]
MNILIKLSLAGALGLVSVAGAAQEMKSGNLMIMDPWVRFTIEGRPAGGYMKVQNSGAQADKLLSATSPLAERVEIHTSFMKDGIMKMRPVAHIDVPAKGYVELKSGGLH